MTLTRSFTLDLDADLLTRAEQLLGDEGTRRAAENAVREAVDREIERRAIQDMIDVGLDPAPHKDNIEP